ncbi:MAG: GAF domain-containing protein [Myxococcota bacterium]
MLYEVFIPSNEPAGYDVQITVDADNWMMALKSGLERTGEGNPDIRNVMCDIKDDNSIHVTDALTRRVFVLKEMNPELEHLEPAVQAPQAQAKAARPAAQPQHAAPQARSAAPKPRQSVSTKAISAPAEALRDERGEVRIGSSTFEAARRDSGTATVIQETRSPTGTRDAVSMGRPKERVSENILEDIFLEIQVIHEDKMAMEEVVNFILDMAMEKVPAESGAVLFADVNGQELYFASARGPKANEIMQFRVPMGIGVAGFCAREGVSLAISDAQRDPRFYAKISQSLSYDTQSVACAPIQLEGRVYGCLELVNRAGGTTFSSNEVNALTYIGNQLAQYINRLIMSREKI